MILKDRPNFVSLKKVMKLAEAGGYAVGAFSPRYTAMIRPVMQAGQQTNSPMIVQISQKELERYGITPKEFADEFFRVLEQDDVTIPIVLHLDHTKEFSIIKDAIAAGFNSVMIDASHKSFSDNVATTKEVVDYAHSRGVCVEAELGMIGTTDFIETDKDEELYTIPEEAMEFVSLTNVDALAVSVGTAHGVYMVREPKVDYKRLTAIRELTPVPLVLHGGSGVPAEMIKSAIRLPDGGISKVNIATDLEVALLEAIGRKERMTNAECSALSPDVMAIAQAAVAATVMDKTTNFLESKDKVSGTDISDEDDVRENNCA